MLKGIPKILSPELLRVLCEMGHGDRICIGDGNFPAESVGAAAEVIRCDGHGIAGLLDAILAVFPLDTYVEKPVTLMSVVEGDPVKTPIWDEFNRVLERHDPRGAETVGKIPRFDFYDAARGCYAIIATGEPALYANIILQKGVVI